MRTRLFGVVAAVAIALGGLASPSVGPARAASVCTGWTSTYVPPTTIRVYRTLTKSTVVVPFRTYVEKVMASEWGPTNPPAALQAGAIAVKQYGWYYARVWRGGKDAAGRCYDVVDSTRDQIYNPSKTVATAHRAAVATTWKVSLRKGSAATFFLTGYRPGTGVCTANIDGWRLYQRDAADCARRYGDSAETIVRRFYSSVSWVSPGAGDFTGDGRGDLAVLVTAPDTGASTGTVYTSDVRYRAAVAAGALAGATLSTNPPGRLVARAAGDVTGDGRVDLVELVRTDAGLALDVIAGSATGQVPAVTWWKGAADPTSILAPAEPASTVLSLVVADVDGDGRADAGIVRARAGDAAAGVAPETTLFVAQAASGAFAPVKPALTVTADLTTAAFFAGDVTGDGRADLVALTPNDTGGTAFQVAASRPRLPLTPLATWSTEAAPLTDMHIVMADVNRDGRDDVIAVRRSGADAVRIIVHRSLGAGPAFSRLWFTGILTTSFAGSKWSAADRTGDGKADLTALVDRGVDAAGAPLGTTVLSFASTGTAFTMATWFSSASLRWATATPY